MSLHRYKSLISTSIYCNVYNFPFTLRFFTIHIKLKEFSLSNFYNHSNFYLNTPLDQWYKKVNSQFCINLLGTKKLNVDTMLFTLHINKIKHITNLNKIFSTKIDLYKMEYAIESLYEIKDYSKFQSYKIKIRQIISEDSLLSLDSWFNNLINITKSNFRKTSQFIDLYDNLYAINIILRTNNSNNWDCVIFHLLIEVYKQKLLLPDVLSSNIESALDHNKNSGDPVSLRASCMLFRDLIFVEWHQSLNSWCKNSIFSIVDNVHKYIRDLYKTRIIGDKQKKGSLAPEIEAFLVYFDLFRLECRTHLLSGQKLVFSKSIDYTLAFPMEEITVLDYTVLTWRGGTFNNFPKDLQEAFLIPIILANVSYLVDLEHFSLEVYNKTSKRGHFYTSINLEEKQCIKLLDIILEQLDMFEKETKVSFDNDNRLKKHIGYYMKDEVWNLMLRENPASRQEFPMVCPPKDWFPDKEGNQLYDGGYLYSSIWGRKGVTARKYEAVSNIKQRLIDALNSLQMQPYNIDIKMLSYILDNYDYALKHFLMGLKSLSAHIVLVESLFLCDGKDEFCKLIHSSLFNDQRSLFYTAIYTGILDFFFLLNLALEYALFGGSFYFVYHIDQRFRTYPTSYLLSTQGSTLAKSLIVPIQLNSDEDPKLFQNILSIKYIKQQILSRQTGKHFFPYINLKLYDNILRFASIDVSSSGSQIYGALMGDLTCLELTNFITDSSKEIIRKDFYEYVLDSFLEELRPKLNEILTPLCVYGIHLEHHQLHIHKFVNLFNRSMAKGWIMRYFYSQGKKARHTELYLLCKANFIFDYAPQRVLSEVLKFFETSFIKVLSCLFPKNLKVLSFHKKIISTSSESYSNVGDNKGYYLPADKTLGQPLIRHFLADIQRINLIRSPSFRSRANVFMNSCIFDKFSAAISIAANATHNRDAVLCFNTLLEALNSKKPIIPSHDAFVCRVQDVDFIQCAYYNNFKRLLVEEDVLLDFLLINSKSSSHKIIREISLRKTILTRHEYNKIPLTETLPSLFFLNLLIESRKNRIEILRLIESGEYVMNPYILA
jgi:hypothetical protein